LLTDGKEVGLIGRYSTGVHWTHPPLCRLPADGKDSLPSAGRWQRIG
jgi:hypothetical protein